ncbi:MAG: hypothetical protein AUG51_08405 [Acidobacteria bacterium 13_1_20CM_3_53_8]|nr:MAG: hypothetical protein AUG51_08405 [Acidobacteria bacterium 13_1_20CM_3_53_8]
MSGRDRDSKLREASSPEEALTSAETGALFEYLREASEQLEVVNRVVAAVNSGRTIDEVFSLASAQMRALLDFDRASIALCEEDGEHLRVFALSGEHARPLTVGAEGLMRGSVTELALKSREMIVIPELSRETRFNVYADLEREGFRSAICCPLFSMHRAVGSLNLTSRKPGAYDRKSLLALERLAPPLAIAIEKVLLLEQAEKRSREMEAAARREELAGRIGRAISRTLDPSVVLQETVDVLGRALKVDRCHISLYEGESDYALVGYEYSASRDVAPLRGHSIPLRKSDYARRVFSSTASLAVNDIEQLAHDEIIELYEKLGVRATLAAPVSVSGVYRGLIELQDCKGEREWTSDDVKLLELVASQVSVALTNAQLYEASRRRSAELEGLYEISRAFTALTDVSEIYGRLTRAIAELVGAERCLLATYDRRSNMVRAEAPSYNILPELIEEFHFKLDSHGGAAYIYRTDEPFFSNDPARDSRFNKSFIERYGVRSVLGVPMRLKKELIGFIYVANRPGGFRQSDVQLLEIFAAQAAETIANTRLFSTIQAQAEREAVVNRLMLLLQQATDAKSAIEVVVERVGEVLGLDRCVATIFTETDRQFVGEWCADGVERVTEDVEVKERSPVPQWLVNNRRPLVVSDTRTHSLAEGLEDILERTKIKSLVAVPITHQGRIIGSLSGHQTRSPRRWAEDDIDLLTAVATQVGSTLENARLITELRDANRLKDEFLATLSHELRTPLTAIKGWVDILAESATVALDEEVSDGIKVIRDSTNALTQLISDLLDLSRIQRKGLPLERKPTNINECIEDAARAVRQSALNRKLHLRLELDKSIPKVSVDGHRIQQVLWNLLTNAIKFTPEGGSITVRSRTLDPKGILIGEEDEASRWVVIEVADTGEGIPRDFLPFIWDRFRQADSSSKRRHGGLGIGLALVKELVEAHGGHVEARSEGRGATFTVRLPAPKTENEQQKISSEFVI